MKHSVRYGTWLARCKIAIVGVFLSVVPVKAETVEILALGDSLTQGYGLFEQDGFVPQLQGWLVDRGQDVRIVNAGVSGDTSAGGFARVEWSLTPEISAMIVTLGGNDLLRGLAPEETRRNIEGILKVAQARELAVLLIGMEAPGNFGIEYKEEFDALYPDLATKYGATYLNTFFAGLGEDRTPSSVAQFMQKDGIHPNPEGVERIVQVVGPKVEELLSKH
ncbi:MAG: arylesterase [Pelagimonas sp.]|uniref:arylesterase n=1 Tax=Pelagimonas sp. TaxID=2073170 RepID=UPI003D6A9052